LPRDIPTVRARWNDIAVQWGHMDFLKSMAGSMVTVVVAGIVLFLVAIGLVGYYQMDPADRTAMWDSLLGGLGTTGRVILWSGVWLVIVALLPVVTFFISAWAGRRDSNLAGAALVMGYTAVDLLVLAWLFDWSIRGAGGWTLFILGGIVAAVYNLFMCDWLAEKTGSA
jgi:hypothetical protein